MQGTSSATTVPEYSGGTSGYWKEKQAKKLEKLKRKEEKEKENNLKHLLEERQEIRFGEVPERNQTDPDWNYEACAREIQRQLAYKVAEQRKHAMKDAERIRKGEAPEHFGEFSMKRNYTRDPKFNVTFICTGLPPEKQTMRLIDEDSKYTNKARSYIRKGENRGQIFQEPISDFLAQGTSSATTGPE